MTGLIRFTAFYDDEGRRVQQTGLGFLCRPAALTQTMSRGLQKVMTFALGVPVALCVSTALLMGQVFHSISMDATCDEEIQFVILQGLHGMHYPDGAVIGVLNWCRVSCLFHSKEETGRTPKVTTALTASLSSFDKNQED